MPIAITPRKGLVAKRIAAQRPELDPNQIAKLVGTGATYVRKAITQERFGRDKVKSIAR